MADAIVRLMLAWVKAKFNAEDSPYRHAYEFFKEANDEGWMPPSMWTRQWEGDMEASYIAGKSVMMMHGPWVWDKALAAGSDFAINGHQNGIPLTPPAEGKRLAAERYVTRHRPGVLHPGR